jgi:hypothetical protein
VWACGVPLCLPAWRCSTARVLGTFVRRGSGSSPRPDMCCRWPLCVASDLASCRHTLSPSWRRTLAVGGLPAPSPNYGLCVVLARAGQSNGSARSSALRLDPPRGGLDLSPQAPDLLSSTSVCWGTAAVVGASYGDVARRRACGGARLGFCE